MLNHLETVGVGHGGLQGAVFSVNVRMRSRVAAGRMVLTCRPTISKPALGHARLWTSERKVDRKHLVGCFGKRE